ncbi:MAG: protein kinase family protein [Rhodospirillaceae bacterium]
MAEAAADLRPAPEKAPPAAPSAAPTPPPPTPETVGAPSSPSGSYIIVRDRFTIFCDRPLPSLDMPNALAYEVADRKQEGRPLYALVCRPDMPPRVSVMRTLKGLEIPAVLHMVDWGVAEWPLLERKCVIVIYHRPLGGKVMDSHFGSVKRIPDHLFARTVIKPIAEGLIELGLKGITHRAIRPDNLYYIDEQKTKIVLGDCVTSVPAHDQPVLLETIESGMAQPSGRGAGTYADDMYAFGASVLMIALGRNPVAGMPDWEIIRRKIQVGSYATLVGDERVPVALIECLRGMLTDDSEQRWQPNNIDLWLNGKRLTPIQAKSEPQSQRPLRFADMEFHSIRPLSYAMYNNWDKALSIISDGSLEVWIRRGLELNDLADSIASAIKGTGAALGKGEADDIIIARVLMLLDPRAPIRYRDFRLFIEGFGSSLAVAMLRKQKLQAFTDFITRELWRYWIVAQTKFIAENQQYEGVFRELRNYLKDQNSGAGIERCVYELNEWQPCMSPLIDDQYVMEVKGVLPALDAMAKTANTKVWPVDRHIAAFLRARYAKGTGSQIDAMNDQRPDRATIGMLSVLAIVQWRLGPDALYGLAQWVGGLMGPVVTSYQNRLKRKEIEKELPKLIRKGNLAEMFNYLDNPEERQKDGEGFAWAKAEYAAAEKLVYDLEHGQVDRQESAILTGRQAGAAGAGFILFMTYLIVFLGKLF